MGFRRLPSLLGFALLIGLPEPASAGSADVCGFRLATVSALFAAANAADAAVDALEQGDATPAADALFGASDLLLAEKKRVAAEWRPHLDIKEKKQLVRTLKAVRKRAAKAARAAARKPATAPTLATAALDAIEAELATQSDARAAGGCDTAAEIRVPELFVGAAKTRTLPGGTTIVAERGIRILGTLRATGPGGGLTLESLAGDVVIEGTLDGTGSPALPETRTSAARARGARGGTDGRPSCGHARPLVIRSSGHNLEIGEDAVFISGSGSPCETISVSDWSQLHEHAVVPGSFGGMHGGNGGDIVLDTSDAGSTLGDIVFEPRPSFAVAPFHLGYGGLGQGVVVDPSLVPLGGSPVFRVVGGSGGDSGAVRTGDDEVTVVWNSPVRVYDPIGGRAGHGGTVVWRATEGSALFPSGIEEVVVLGGNGGVGVFAGGAGGAAFYTGNRVVNVTGTPITAATAFGGFGGSVLDLEILFRGEDDQFVTGGDGGDALVIGHRGWDGSPEWRDGAEGGVATATAGLAGNAAGIDDLRARGGNGGHAMGVGGSGGNGRPGSCVPEDTAAGGDGGFGGSIFLTGGEGGEASLGTGGDGGFVFLATLGVPGLGGGGSPAGLFGGPPVQFSTAAGSGGAGRVPGVGGTAAAPIIPPDSGTNHYTCEEVPPQRDPCGTPQWYQASLVEHSTGPLGDTSTVIRETAESICGPSGCRWIGHGSIETASGDGSQTYLYSSDDRSLPTGRIETGLGTHCPAPGAAHQGSGSHTTTDPNTGTVVTMRHSSSGSHMCRVDPKWCCRNISGGLGAYPPDDPHCRE